MIIFRHFSFALLFLSFGLTANARDLDEQRVVYLTQKQNTEYRLALSSIKTIDARIVAERDVLLRGDVEQSTYEFNPGITPSEAWFILFDSFDNNTYRELFSCDGLSCGSSNAWANNRFEIKQLYGLEQTQKYRVLAHHKSNEYIVIYFVQRGNKRIYAQLDRVKTNTPTRTYASAETINNLLSRQGYYAVDVNDNNESGMFVPSHVEEIVLALKKNPIGQYYLVGHCNSHVKYEDNFECAEEFSTALQAAMVERGIPERRLVMKSVGQLAPRENIPKNRVELVAKRRF